MYSRVIYKMDKCHFWVAWLLTQIQKQAGSVVMEQCLCFAVTKISQLHFRHGWNWLFWRKKKLLVSEKARSRSCTPTAPCNGTSQATTTSGATHSLQEPLLRCPSEIQHPLNSGEGEGWTSRWNRISLWLFKYKSHVSWRQVFHRDHGCAETKTVIPAIHSFQESLPVAQVPYWNVTYIDASASVVSH